MNSVDRTSLRSVKDEIRSLIRNKTYTCKTMTAIKELNSFNEEAFRACATKGIPLIYRGVASEWLLTNGGIKFFAHLYSDLRIDVRIGSYSRGNGELKTRESSAGKYLEELKSDEDELAGYAGYQIVPEGIHRYMNYPRCLPTDKVEHPFHFWLGPKNTYTAIHSDTPDKFVYQCEGKKRWYLIAPQYYDSLYIDSDFGRGYDTSPIDPRFKSNSNFPEFNHDCVKSFILAEGDMLFLPGGWYHAVESLSLSLSFEYKSNPVPLSINDLDTRSHYLEKIIQIKKENAYRPNKALDTDKLLASL